jgi:hypothetical protein
VCKEVDGLCLKLLYCTPGLVRTSAESTPYKGATSPIPSELLLLLLFASPTVFLLSHNYCTSCHLLVENINMRVILHRIYISYLKSQLSLENKLLVYKAILKPIWTYGVHLMLFIPMCYGYQTVRISFRLTHHLLSNYLIYRLYIR